MNKHSHQYIWWVPISIYFLAIMFTCFKHQAKPPSRQPNAGFFSNRDQVVISEMSRIFEGRNYQKPLVFSLELYKLYTYTIILPLKHYNHYIHIWFYIDSRLHKQKATKNNKNRKGSRKARLFPGDFGPLPGRPSRAGLWVAPPFLGAKFVPPAVG